MKPNSRLKREREWRGWSQAALAKEIGIDPQSISRWERGASHPHPALREKLCTLFGKNPDELGLLETETPSVPEDDRIYPSPHPFQRLFDPAIPSPRTSVGVLIERAELLIRLKQSLLSMEMDAFILLQGLPGVGKTTLASFIANDKDVQNYFHDGILWAGLGPAPNLSAHMSRWAKQLGHSIDSIGKGDNGEEWARVIHASTQERRILFILDDVWELETLIALKVGGKGCAYLVTTRIPQVTQYFAPQDVWTVGTLNERDSLALLAQFVPGLVQDDSATLQTLVEAVGGLPLALTLIGRYLRSYVAKGQPRRLQAALQHVYDSNIRLHLSEPSPFVDHQPSLPAGSAISLSAIISVSEQIIGERERLALRSLSVFPAKPHSFSEEAALAVCQISVDVLDILSDAGLLESPEPMRYQLHQTIADYARISFVNRSAVIKLFVEYMVQFVENNSGDYNVLEIESGNIFAALDQALQLDIHTAYIRGVIAISPFCEIRGLYSLATRYLQQAYHIARGFTDCSYRMLTLFHLGQISQAQNQLQQAETYLREGLLYARQLNDRKMANHFLIALAEVLELRGDYSQARQHLREGLNLAGYPIDTTRVFFNLIPIYYSEETMCVHFTEPQHMLRRGYLADVHDIFASWRHAEALAPDFLDIVRGTNGHLYGIPTQTYVMCLAYNRRLFQDAGLDPDCPPRTWDEFRAIARQVTNSRKHIYGFASETISNQGGWHFTNWLYTAGVLAQEQRDGVWQATFHDRRAAELLEMLKEMSFSDGSIPRQILLKTETTLDLFRKGQVAMIITSSFVIKELFIDKSVDIGDIGLAPMPQRGGNACLMGGTAFVFNVQSPLSSVKMAFERITSHAFHLDDYEAFIKQAVLAGEAIGVPGPSILAEAVQQEHDNIEAKYMNVPLENYRPLMDSKLKPILEPPIEAQKYYALLDPIVQAVLTNPQAHSQQLLDIAAHQFQERFLDHAEIYVPPA